MIGVAADTRLVAVQYARIFVEAFIRFRIMIDFEGRWWIPRFFHEREATIDAGRAKLGALLAEHATGCFSKGSFRTRIAVVRAGI